MGLPLIPAKNDSVRRGGTGVTLLPIQCAKFLEFHVECSHSILTAEVTEKP